MSKDRLISHPESKVITTVKEIKTFVIFEAALLTATTPFVATRLMGLFRSVPKTQQIAMDGTRQELEARARSGGKPTKASIRGAHQTETALRQMRKHGGHRAKSTSRLQADGDMTWGID